MTVNWPDGAVVGLPAGTTEATVSTDTNADWMLLGLAGAYHTGQTRLTVATERSARDLWLRMRPVTDADMNRWMDAYNGILEAASKQQAGLTRSYIRQSMSALGASVEPAVAVPPADVVRVQEWLDTPQGRVASTQLRTEVEKIALRSEWTAAEQALADRLRWLHSPVVKRRWHLSEGMTPDEALQAAEPSVATLVDTALRTTESDVVSAVGWPTFKNGIAMLYKRVPQAGACGWCRVVATRLYSLDSFKAGRAWHVGCRCTWQAVQFKEARAYADWLQRRPGDYYGAAENNGYWSGERPAETDRFDAKAAADAGYVSTPTGPRTTTSGAASTQRSPRTSATATTPAALPGQVTPERLASVRLQIDQLRNRPANEWSQKRLTELADELDKLLQALGA